MGGDIYRMKFRDPDKGECIGKADAGTCMDCLKKNPAKIACKKMGEFLNNADWNRIVGTGPQQVKDFKVREAQTAPCLYGRDRVQEIDKHGKILKVRKVA